MKSQSLYERSQKLWLSLGKAGVVPPGPLACHPGSECRACAMQWIRCEAATVAL